MQACSAPVSEAPALSRALAQLSGPVAVFDAGIGSYAVVALLQRHYPTQDLIYFADRASFPYGAKPKDELARLIGATVQRLADWGARAVVLASNAPSVMVLDALRGRLALPVRGIYPPVREALAVTSSGVVAVLGVASLAASPEITAYIKGESAGHPVQVVNASSMVELVENGVFLRDPAATQAQVDGFMQGLLRQHPGLDVCTLSSTHLPWLAPFFERAAPTVKFLDPAQATARALGDFVGAPGTSAGRQGRVVCVATESSSQPLSGLRSMLAALGVCLEPHGVPPTRVENFLETQT